jgi:hypothetical protein
MTTAPVFAQGNAVPAERLVIRFQQDGLQGGSFEVIDRRRVTKVLPPSDELPHQGLPVSGFYYELQSDDGTIRYRRIIGNPIPYTVEVARKPVSASAENLAQRPLEWEQVVPEQRIFTILIPQSNASDQLVLFSSPIYPSRGNSLILAGDSSPAAREVARLGTTPSSNP